MYIKQPYAEKNFVGEINSLPSATIPDQTMSIPTLIKRYAQGLPLGAPFLSPIYDPNPEEDILGGKDIRKFDISEQHQLIKDVSREYKNLQEKRNKKPEKQQKAEE
jgi:hypothetical protein